MSQFLVTVLAEIARMERRTIQNRLASGYQNFLSNDGKVGRKPGYRKSGESLRTEYAEEIKMLKKGYSYQHISRITNTNKNTLTKLKKLVLN